MGRKASPVDSRRSMGKERSLRRAVAHSPGLTDIVNPAASRVAITGQSQVRHNATMARSSARGSGGRGQGGLDGSLCFATSHASVRKTLQ